MERFGWGVEWLAAALSIALQFTAIKNTHKNDPGLNQKCCHLKISVLAK